MTKKEFAQKVIKDPSNTVFTTEDQVMSVLETFAKIGFIFKDKDDKKIIKQPKRKK